MNPKISNETSDEYGSYKFTLSGVNVCFANALRRIILSDIETVVFRTFPYEKNKCSISINTSRFTNEILKHRLSAIPINITDPDFPLDDYIMELDVKNETENVISVTTENFKIKQKNGKYLPDSEVKKIFSPFISPFNGQKYFTQLLVLRPQISEDIEGEHIQLVCEFSRGSTKEDGSFNIVGTCSYGRTVDETKQEEILIPERVKWQSEGKDLDREEKNWRLLNGLRFYKDDSFDFIIKTVGVYSNIEILQKACEVLIDKIDKIIKQIDEDTFKIKEAENTMENCYDIYLENEDYTVGNIFQYILFNTIFERKIVSFVGFSKKHPHDSYSIIRLSYIEETTKEIIKSHIKTCCDESNHVIRLMFALWR